MVAGVVLVVALAVLYVGGTEPAIALLMLIAWGVLGFGWCRPCTTASPASSAPAATWPAR
ncbi:hypothetical protein GCM10009789_01690 [Kribbella sancticallisti]|uniref:Uncharacterized protein n=1 Tax=Kribbella sancticallisti TaxID=460087 RepID=A0ABP4MX65_9ACTN